MMNHTNTISQNIAKLRHEKQAKQEELANYVGVSAQAVSKWENGGMPDADLLPKIADFFGTSIDALFGRKPMESGDLWKTLVESTSEDQTLERSFEICEKLLQAIDSGDAANEPEPIKLDDDLTSQVIIVQRNCGFAKIAITKDIPYFLLLPDFSGKKTELFDRASLPDLFSDLGDHRSFETIVYLMRRESNKAFSSNLITKKLGYSQDETHAVIEKLHRYGLLSSTTVEIDEEEITMYNVNLPRSFCAMIRFARELL